MKRYGLIGYPLSHSFSQRYFSEKFERENITNAQYELFALENIEDLPTLIAQHPDLCGLNVTIPHKQKVMKFLDKIETSAQRIGAVNVIKIQKNKLIGYNSDYEGFKISLTNFLGTQRPAAMILGTGGAAQAVRVALEDLGIRFITVSRQASPQSLSYEQINPFFVEHFPLIINTTPLGMSPKTDICPRLPYESLNEKNFVFDLVYNPEKTLLLQKAQQRGAKTINGLEMLYLQAEKAWQIWQENDTEIS